MRFLVMVKPPTAAYESGMMPSPKLVANMGAFNAELVKAGVMLAAEGLHPSSKGARISFAGGKPTVHDGPFAETKELVGGFWLIQVKSKDEAIEWLRRCPFEGDEVIELRQIHDAEDFIAAMEPKEHGGVASR
jgi:hypothetical protein